MKQYIRNPLFYMIGMPLAAMLWFLLAFAWAYPQGQRNWDAAKTEFEESQKHLGDILALEPQRLAYQQDKTKNSEFDFTNMVDQFAKQYAVGAADYTLSVHSPYKKSGKTAKSADLTIKAIDMERLSKFISAMLIRWPEMECERLALEKNNVGKNSWKVSMKLTYYY